MAKCFAFLWGVQTPVIVMDIDGTITRSDVPGLLTTLSLGIYDHTHSGICGLLTRIVKEVLYCSVYRWRIGKRTMSQGIRVAKEGCLDMSYLVVVSPHVNVV